eukprot:sb/3472374/
MGDLHNLDEIIKLDLSFNLFKTVPNSLSSCVALVQLSLDNNELKHSLPSWVPFKIWKLCQLANNKITTIAPEIGALRKLSCLILKNNNITRIPDNFAYCYALTTLDVDVEKLEYPPSEEPTETSKQPIKTCYLGHMTSYQPIGNQYFLIRSVPDVIQCKCSFKYSTQ